MASPYLVGFEQTMEFHEPEPGTRIGGGLTRFASLYHQPVVAANHMYRNMPVCLSQTMGEFADAEVRALLVLPTVAKKIAAPCPLCFATT